MPTTPEIDPLLLRAISGVMATRLRGIKAAEERLVREVSTIDSKTDDLNHENLWDAIVSILDHAAALSRMFWQPWVHKDTPAKRAAKHYNAEQLRLWLSITDDSLFNEVGRYPRNTIEHWGENCADWYEQMAGRRVVDSIVTASGWSGNEFYLRSYTYVPEVVSYGDATVELRPLLIEAWNLYDRLGVALAALGEDTTYTQKGTLRIRPPVNGPGRNVHCASVRSAAVLEVDDGGVATSGWARRLWPSVRSAQVLVVFSVAVFIAVIVGWCVGADLLSWAGLAVFVLMTQVARLIEDKARLKERIARHPDL